MIVILKKTACPFLWVPARSLRSQKNLEAAMEILEREFEAVEKTKVEVDKLKTGKLDDAKAEPLPAYIRNMVFPHIIHIFPKSYLE